MKLQTSLFLSAVLLLQTALTAFSQNDTVRAGRFTRGTGTNAMYQSFVIPLDMEQGLACSNNGGIASSIYPWFPTGGTYYHYNATNVSSATNLALRIPFVNPIACFGSAPGGSPLYFGQQYRFGMYSGQIPPNNSVGIVLYTFSVSGTNWSLANSTYVALPNASNTNDWLNYQTNGYTRTVITNGLTTIINFDQGYIQWGDPVQGNITISHIASPAVSNYVFLVDLVGFTDKGYMVLNSSGAASWCPMYTLQFEQRPAWRATYIDQPHFANEPLPSFYEGKSTDELLANTTPVTTAFTLSNAPSSYTNLDNSPELRRHPILDQFVADMRGDPVALARFVFNEIELTDALDYNARTNVTDVCINPAGVSRSALGTYLEKQGSPSEQCALLVYLLRQAGVPAVYVYPPYNGMKLLDTQLSRILRIQFQGAVNEQGQAFTTNRVIPVNYPWVAAYIGTNWVHLFPWMKDTDIEEGLNLRDYMGTNYPSGTKWMEDYVYGRTNILSLASNGDDTAGALFPKFIKQNLLQIAPGVSLDDIGIQWYNRRHTYAQWQDFPTPLVTPTNATALDNFSSPAITNIYMGLTNIFDTFSVQVTSRANPSKTLQSGTLRLADLCDRRFLVRFEKTGTNTHNMILSLESYRTNTTGPTNFAAGDTLLNSQQISTNLTSTDDLIDLKMIYSRNRAAWASSGTNLFGNLVHISGAYPVLYSAPGFIDTRSIRKGSLAAICLDVGRVSRDMLNIQAQEIWNMEATLKANPSATNTLSPDLYQGGVAYLMGMAYHENCDNFDRLNQRLHKVRTLSHYAQGIASLAAKHVSGSLPNNGDVILTQPSVDMSVRDTTYAFGGTIHADSGDDVVEARESFAAVGLAHDSSEEHHALNSFFTQSDSISTVRLLQLAQSRGNGIYVLNNSNYIQMGNISVSGTLLKNWDTNIWASITNHLTRVDAIDNIVFMTPGAITNNSNTYKGVGALLWSPGGQTAALIGGNSLNGGVAPFMPDASFGLNNTFNYDLNFDPNSNFYLTTTTPTSSSQVLAPDNFANYDTGSVVNNIAQNGYAYTQFQTAWTSDYMDAINLNSQGSLSQNFSQSVQADQGNSGFMGWMGDALDTSFTHVSDPVHSVTGEFYINTTDLTLPGPMPLAVNRNYSSLNMADNQFGYGWKLNYMPYLSLNSSSNVIFAAEADGAVLAYQQTATNANLYLPNPALNPQLNNNHTAGIGSTANQLQNMLVKQVSGTNTFYYLYSPDGSTRTFQVLTFTGSVNNTRPYLLQWQDSRGNYFSFQYGTDSTQADYGQVRRVQSSNGNFLGFYYDVYGHIIQAYTGDGRSLIYQYDQYGDLESVTLPDQAVIQYQYAHSNQSVTNGSTVTVMSYSTHLIVEEDKPDGRALINSYDSQRRVTNQLSTAGVDLTPVRTATFVYSNNFNLTNSYTNTITGYTLVIDANSKTNRYDYTNSLVTKITDPLGQTIQQSWYADNATAPGYPRSLYQTKDKRGLWTQFQYDGEGNVTNTVKWGDLTGDGTTQYATNTFAYTTNNLSSETVDAAGNKVDTTYDPQFPFLPSQVVRSAGNIAVSTNAMAYCNVTSTFVSGGVTYTNAAFGLLQQQVRAAGSPDAATNVWFYDGRGYPTQSVQFTGTSDPAVTNSYFYNGRDELAVKTDAAGRSHVYDYDPMGRPISHEVYEANQSVPVSWNYSYYNANGELTWNDGPRYNPEDYIWRDYDGAGRLTTEIHWRSEAKLDGTGVESPAGYNLYAQSINQYDRLGNLTLAVDPRQAMTTNTWDVLSRLVQRKHLDTDGVTVLSTEGFGYEPGGQVKYYTNALGGVTTTLYTITGQPEYRGNPDGSTNGWRYYLDGRIKREIQSNGAYWQTTFDDVNLITTRIFYSATGTSLATNSTQLDRRGNVIQRVDAGGNVFTTTFDDLDRAKVTAGPAIVTVSSIQDLTGKILGYVTNVLQQASTNIYDVSGSTLTSANALGEKTVTQFDALGRTTSAQMFSSAGALVRESYNAYSADHHSVTTTNGSGANAIVHTTYTDNDGHTVLAIAYPSGSLQEFALNQYDLAGNLATSQHSSSTGGNVTVGTAAAYQFDGLNRMTAKVDRDYALTVYAYDAMNDLTNRTMPGGLQWQAAYNNAGQILRERNVGGSSATRTNTYTYFASGSAFAGLPQSKTDGRGVSCTYSYDDWLRATNMAYSGSAPEQNLTTSFQYEPRGLATAITEKFSTTNTGPVTTIQRTYDPYGQLASESVNGGLFGYGASQSWDAAGRRSQLGIGSGSYGFSWRADGTLASAADSTGSGGYSYDTAGLLTNRIVGNRVTGIASRDGAGRPLTITTTVNTLSQLAETLTWSGDGLLASHTLARADFTDSHAYAYASLSRRLTQEQLNLDGSTRWTNNLTYDNGVASGAGVLTKMGQASGTSNTWNGVADAFSRVGTETNNTISYTAYGHVNGQSALSAWVDNRPTSITGTGTNAMQWSAKMEIAPGAHKLKVAALHPSGYYTALATNSFTNNIAYQTTGDAFDNAGNITQRVWKNANGTTNRIQTLAWDARGRLYSVTERGTNNSGYNWTATYDGLSRRISTTSIMPSNGVAFSSQPTTINSYFDPQVEFLELGVSYGTKTEWKLHGPDLNGVYGGLNGTGGFEAVSPYLNQFYPTVSDFRGNILGVITNGVVSWNPSRPTGYGAVPGYRPVPLGNGASISLSSAWRGRWVDITGYHQIGLRPYDSVSGRWLTYDSVWNERDPNYYSFCGGDPINGFDADGRCVDATGNFIYNGGVASYALNGIGNALNSYSGDNSYLGASAAFAGSLFNEAGSMTAPSTYVNGLNGYANNVSTVYDDSGFWAAGSYATTSWNVGAVYSGAANINLATGQPVGDWYQRGTEISGGVASTAGIAAGGLGVYNWATAPASANANILSGHGGLVVGDSSPVTTVPQGTSLTVWTEHGNPISDALGNAIETGSNVTLDQFPEAAGARSYLPGSVVPNYTLYPPTWGNPISIMGNPTTVAAPANLSTLLQPGMGNVSWAACLSVTP